VDYVLIIHPAEEGGYWAEVAGLEGCFAQGDTLEEVLEESRGAIASHLEALHEDGQAVPREESVIIATVRLSQPSPA
jgi:predicted RNase H-like HicB family nuclease